MIEAPFFPGDKIIAVNALDKSLFKNGKIYTVSACDYNLCKGCYYWYVGVHGITNGNAYYRPSIFELIESKFAYEDDLLYLKEINEYVNNRR